MTNAIRSLIYSRIKALLAQSEGLANVPHNLTKGELREQLLLEFFNDILPDRYTICSGFITDRFENVSPQIDFIVAETSEIPRLVLNREVSLVPIEAARAFVEIKTRIDLGFKNPIDTEDKDGDRLKKQIESVRNMHPSLWSAIPTDFNLRAYVIGFDANEKSLNEFLDTKMLRGCCVVGKYAFLRHELLDPGQYVRLEDDPDNGEFEATATFLGCVYRDLEVLSLTHSPYYQLAEMLNNMADPTMKLAAQHLLGKRWFWEAYVSETIAKAAEEHLKKQGERSQ